jgi:hypothetical protein
LTWGENRLALKEQIESYEMPSGKSFCSKDGEVNTYFDLTRHINNSKNTVVYSIDNDDIDCVLVFCDNKYEKSIIVKAFCSNQIIHTKKGGVFFDYFLNSLRGKYKHIMLDSDADTFYETFHFSENRYGVMTRSISPKSSTNRSRKHYNRNTIPGDVTIIYKPSRVKSAQSKSTRKKV